ncbi:hypothetical protein ETAA8_09630 [Anatilimnocola aggregata]|uniref:Uncharacterized protein n=1 Tax=Anatilimnocola aggregata TaxID=2528021 RepID=A0A517Y6N0_9BACT|nr:hypothetical protein ETAA8_09630 [Anatilimnocola aggregata]
MPGSVAVAHIAPGVAAAVGLITGARAVEGEIREGYSASGCLRSGRVKLMARLEDCDAVALQQADISAIKHHVYDLTDPVNVVSSITLDKTEVIFDTLQYGRGWTIDSAAKPEPSRWVLRIQLRIYDTIGRWVAAIAGETNARVETGYRRPGRRSADRLSTLGSADDQSAAAMSQRERTAHEKSDAALAASLDDVGSRYWYRASTGSLSSDDKFRPPPHHCGRRRTC